MHIGHFFKIYFVSQFNNSATEYLVEEISFVQILEKKIQNIIEIDSNMTLEESSSKFT